MEWISIKEVCNLTNKSESTIRNLARKLKASNSKNIRLETLKTGHDKILFKLSSMSYEFKILDTISFVIAFFEKSKLKLWLFVGLGFLGCALFLFNAVIIFPY